MHINPAIVDGAKAVLGLVTAAGSLGVAAKLTVDTLADKGPVSLGLRGLIATAVVLFSFQVLPHPPVGVSEVHFIFGSTLFLILGAAPAAIGLALGLLLQGLLFAPFDLPQYGMNVTTIVAPLLALHWAAGRVVAKGTAFVDLGYRQALGLSTLYQGGIVAWVAFWTLYMQGAGAETLAALGTFAAAYMLVVVIEPLVDLALLALAKRARALEGSALVTPRLYRA